MAKIKLDQIEGGGVGWLLTGTTTLLGSVKIQGAYSDIDLETHSSPTDQASVKLFDGGTDVNKIVDLKAINSDGISSISVYKGATDGGVNINSSKGQSILLGGSFGFKIQDSTNEEGMYYGADYSTNGISERGDRWIPDKGYVDSVSGGGGWSLIATSVLNYPATGAASFNAVNGITNAIDITGQTGTQTYDFITQNLLDTARASTGAANFLRLQNDGTDVFKVNASGDLTVANITSGALTWTGTNLTIGNIRMNSNRVGYFSNSGGAINTSVSSSTVATILPKWVSSNTGMGGVANEISLITGGIEAINIDASQNVSMSPDVDKTFIFGRTRIDSRGADNVYISHYNFTGTSDYGLNMTPGGTLRINATSGQSINFRINNSSKWVIGPTGTLMANSDQLFILGNKVDPDPTGANGMLYYNTTNNKFRAYENSAWVDLIGAGGGITNGGANNEIVKSDGTNIIGTKLFSSANGDLTLGDSGSGFNPTIQAISSGGVASLNIFAEGTGVINYSRAIAGDILQSNHRNTSGTAGSDAEFVIGTSATSAGEARLAFTNTGNSNNTGSFIQLDADEGLKFIVDNGSILINRIELNDVGIGFFNVAPVAQPAHIADATDAASAITQLNLLLAKDAALGLQAAS